MKEISKPQSQSEKQRYEQLKKIIVEKRESAFQWWSAVTEVKESKSYREEFETWDDFSRSYLNLSPKHANRMISHHKLLQESKTSGPTGPLLVERQSREIKKVAPEKQSEVIEVAASSGTVTAASIAKAKKVVEAIEAKVVDDYDHPIPVKVQEFWHRRGELKELVSELARIIKLLKTAEELADPLFSEIPITNVVAMLTEITSTVRRSYPTIVCGQCQGHPKSQKEGCRVCGGRGLNSEFYFRKKIEPTQRDMILKNRGMK